jgi:hypothetical protein
MKEYHDYLVVLVVIAAFVAGYWLVSFVMKFLKDLKDRPPLNEEFWRQPSEAEKAKQADQGEERRQENFHTQADNTSKPPPVKT